MPCCGEARRDLEAALIQAADLDEDAKRRNEILRVVARLRATLEQPALSAGMLRAAVRAQPADAAPSLSQ